jgi:hypothetical protein
MEELKGMSPIKGRAVANHCFFLVSGKQSRRQSSFNTFIFNSTERKRKPEKQIPSQSQRTFHPTNMAHLLDDEEIGAGMAKGKEDLLEYLKEAKKPVKYGHEYRDLMAANGESRDYRSYGWMDIDQLLTEDLEKVRGEGKSSKGSKKDDERSTKKNHGSVKKGAKR